MNDSILFWNAVALEANRVSHSDPAKAQQQGPTLSSRALAIVHLAMYDAYARVEANLNTFPLYLRDFSVPVPPTATPTEKKAAQQQAVAGAAYTALITLYRAQKDFFDTQVLFFETNFEPSSPNPPTASFQLGVAAARELLRIRANDPGAGADGYRASMARYRHRVDPDNPMQGFHAPFYGFRSRVFAVSTRHSLDAPPRSTGNNTNESNFNKKYIPALQQVRAKGIRPDLTATLPSALFNERRTADENLIGIFWAYDGSNRLGTPPRQYNQIIRQIAVNKNNTEGDNARLFAFVNAAMGDAGILAWEQKYCHDFWRPVLGIREHDTSFGPQTAVSDNEISNDADPCWLPLGAPNTNNPTMKNFTPNFPAYPSGHATFGAAAFHITRLFYKIKEAPNGRAVIDGGKKIIDAKGNLIGDDLFNGLSFVSDELNGMNQDNTGTVRPRHVRNFPLTKDLPSSGGLGKMIIENARSRVYLGVHWIFDAFLAQPNSDLSDEINPDFKTTGTGGNQVDGLRIGGVPLGLRIAEDIFKTGGGLAPRMMTNDPDTKPPIAPPPDSETVQPSVPPQPAKQTGCADATPPATTKQTKKTKTAPPVEPAQADEQSVEAPFLGGTSHR